MTGLFGIVGTVDIKEVNTMPIEYLNKDRKLSLSVLEEMGVVEKDHPALGRVAAFPYKRDGTNYAAKFRSREKKFASTKEVSRGVYNEDALWLNGPVVITEGEIDCLSVIDTGHKKAISLPNGWSERGTTSEALYDVREKLLESETVIVAGDNDAAGESLPRFVAALLHGHDVRYAEWPEGCKDANDVLVQYGPERLSECLQAAIKIDPEGGHLTDLTHLPPLSERRVLRTGIPFSDERVALECGAMSVLTGYPGTGKSTLSTWLAYNVAKNEDVNVGFFSFETHPHRTRDHICRLHTGYEWDRAPDQARQAFNDFAAGRLYMVHRTYDRNVNHNLEWLMDYIHVLAVRERCKLIIVDPWNEIEHLPEKGESLTNYINYALQQIRAWSEKLNVHVMVVAHPRKVSNDGGPTKPPTGYDIADSAAFSNKPSLGLSVFNETDADGQPHLKLVTWKVRDTQLYGIERGQTDMEFNSDLMRYESAGSAAYHLSKNLMQARKVTG